MVRLAYDFLIPVSLVFELAYIQLTVFPLHYPFQVFNVVLHYTREILYCIRATLVFLAIVLHFIF